MSFTKEERIENINEMINQYFSLIFKTINDISKLLEKQKELKNDKEK